jgi:hypothetical protein
VTAGILAVGPGSPGLIPGRAKYFVVVQNVLTGSETHTAPWVGVGVGGGCLVA